MRGNVLVRCGEGSGETDTRKVHGALVLLHIYGVYTEYVSEPVTSNARVKWNA